MFFSCVCIFKMLSFSSHRRATACSVSFRQLKKQLFFLFITAKVRLVFLGKCFFSYSLQSQRVQASAKYWEGSECLHIGNCWRAITEECKRLWETKCTRTSSGDLQSSFACNTAWETQDYGKIASTRAAHYRWCWEQHSTKQCVP